MSRWLPALRIARRTVLRSPGRSLLVALLVGLPVAGATVADVLVRTIGSPERDAQREIGSADAVAAGISAARLAGLAPRGTRIAPNPRVYALALERRDGTTRTPLVTADASEPLHRHYARVIEGRAPRSDGEVLVTRALAKRLDLLDGGDRLRAGAAITMRRGPRASVTGIAREQFCLDCAAVVAAPRSAIARAARGRSLAGSGQYIESLALADERRGQIQLLDLPRGASTDELAAILRGQGAQLATRDRIAHPPSRRSGTADAATLRAAALAAVGVGLGLLEVVLLAGTAFAVGARRQIRELGLVAASGGSPRDVRRIVLAQGLVLGALGAVAGVAVGGGLAVAGRPLWEHYDNAEMTAWVFGPWEIAGAMLVGLLSGLAAAVVPAVGAGRMRPVHALAGRFRERRPRGRRNAVLGSALLTIGAIWGVVGDRMLADEFRAYSQRAASATDRGFVIPVPSSDTAVGFIVGGGTLAVIGLVLLAPVLIGLLARLGGRLPLSARLAVRDAERQRHRTGPATGAILVVVAGAVFAAYAVAMVFRADDVRIIPSLPPHVLAISPDTPMNRLPARALLAASSAAAAEVPGARRHVVRTVDGPGPAALNLIPRVDACPADLADLDRCGTLVGSGRVVVASPAGSAAAVLAGGRLDRSARVALAAGKVLVFDPGMLDRAGTVLVQSGSRARSLPGHLVRRERPYRALPSALVSPALVRAQGWSATRVDQVLVTYAGGAGGAAVDSASAAAVDAGASVLTDVVNDASRNTILLVVALIAALVTLFGVAISAALSAAEGRADLATLAAVGAPPGRRRRLVAVQALLVGGLGGLLGVGLGTFVAFTARATTGSPDFVVPWWNLAAAGLGAPLVAALVAAACTRGRLPLVRRAE
jgi:putative ABC transport system permease protein